MLKTLIRVSLTFIITILFIIVGYTLLNATGMNHIISALVSTITIYYLAFTNQGGLKK